MTALRVSPDLSLPLDVVTLAITKHRERICARLERGIRRGDADACWPWRKAHDGLGYGHVRVGGVVRRTHRIVFFLAHGWWPPVVMHTCDNPPCCNLRHLVAGTKAENNADKMRKGRHRSARGERSGAHTHPEKVSRGDAHYARQRPELLARGEGHGQAKVTAHDVEEMRARWRAGGTTKIAIARDYGIGQSHIARILNGEGWK